MKSLNNNSSHLLWLGLMAGGFVLGCSTIFPKALTETDLPKAKSEVQKIKVVGYYVLCEGTFSKYEWPVKNSADNGKETKGSCQGLFSDTLGNKESLGRSFSQALNTTFNHWRWVNLETEFSKSSAFSRCYSKVLFLDSLVFQQCINSQESRRKIQEEFHLDAVAYLTVNVAAEEQDKANLVLLVPGVHDKVVDARIKYKFDLGTAANDPLLWSEEWTSDTITLNAFVKVAGLKFDKTASQLGDRTAASEKPTVLTVKTNQFLSGIKSKMGLP